MGDRQPGPTVLLEAGMASFSTNWYWVQTTLATTSRVVAYDRAGNAFATHYYDQYSTSWSLLYNLLRDAFPAQHFHAGRNVIDIVQHSDSATAILDDGSRGVGGMRCQRMELGEPDKSGRRRPVAIAGSEFDLECDTVVMAIGTDANPILGETSDLKLNDRGYLSVDEDLATSLDGVFAGGDIVTGAATVIEAMGAGRRAARAMKRYLGLVDSDVPYADGAADTLFGFAPEQREYARVHVV